MASTKILAKKLSRMLSCGGVLFAISGVLLVINSVVSSDVSADMITALRQNELKDLLYQDCGSCHGMRLSGGLGPSLTKPALQGKSREFLFVTISDGRFGTPMPPWGKLLSDADIYWLVDFLMQGEY